HDCCIYKTFHGCQTAIPPPLLRERKKQRKRPCLTWLEHRALRSTMLVIFSRLVSHGEILRSAGPWFQRKSGPTRASYPLLDALPSWLMESLGLLCCAGRRAAGTCESTLAPVRSAVQSLMGDQAVSTRRRTSANAINTTTAM